MQVMVVHPTDREYKDVASNKLVPKFPIITHDITNANSTFGTNLAGLRVNSARNKPIRDYMEEYVNISEYFYKLHKLVMLTANVMFVNGNVFMITAARKLNFVTFKHIPSQTA